MPPTKKELFIAAIVMLAIPMLAECALRIAQVQFEPQLYIADREKGWSLRPGGSGVATGETRQFVRINTNGFRDKERSFDKPANSVRIAVLGNSWTEALQVPLEKTYCSVLEHKLAELPSYAGKNVEVLNFGVSGYSTAQELITLQEDVWKYHPDVLVVAFYSARDIANNTREFNNAADPEQSPYFVYRGDKLALDDSFRSLSAVQNRQIMLQRIRAGVNDHVRVLQAVNALVRYGRTQVALAAVKEKKSKTGTESLEHSIYAPPTQKALEEAWRVTEGLLVEIHKKAKSRGVGLIIVTLANRPQVIPDINRRAAFMTEYGVSNLSYADDRINALGAWEGISVINLAPALSEFAEKNHVYLNGFNDANWGEGHWNETGHRVAAETIALNWQRAVEPRLAQAEISAR